jgi:hypothetical protein
MTSRSIGRMRARPIDINRPLQLVSTEQNDEELEEQIGPVNKYQTYSNCFLYQIFNYDFIYLLFSMPHYKSQLLFQFHLLLLLKIIILVYNILNIVNVHHILNFI